MQPKKRPTAVNVEAKLASGDDDIDVLVVDFEFGNNFRLHQSLLSVLTKCQRVYPGTLMGPNIVGKTLLYGKFPSEQLLKQ